MWGMYWVWRNHTQLYQTLTMSVKCVTIALLRLPSIYHAGIHKITLFIHYIWNTSCPLTRPFFFSNSGCNCCKTFFFLFFTNCRNCSYVVYCSSECESEAWEEYHKVECEFVSWMRSSSLRKTSSNLGRITQLALRISLKAGYENLKIHFKNVREDKYPLEAGFTNGVYLNGYSSVFSMVSHKDARPMNVRKDYAVLAALAILLLDSSNFFYGLAERNGENSGVVHERSRKTETDTVKGELDPLEVDNGGKVTKSIDAMRFIYAASLIHHMQIIQCNAYGTVESDSPSTGFRMKEAVYSGLALYPTMGLINHSCDPVLDISFSGSTAIYRAYTNVKEGSQITVDYGPIYYLQKKEERRAHLQNNYYFHCQCAPCKFNWPMWDQIESKVPEIKMYTL